MAESNRAARSPGGSAALILGSGALLLCAQGGFWASFLSLYPIATGERPVVLWAAAFALISLCAWSLPRHSPKVCGGLTAVWVLAALWNRKAFTQGALLVCSAVADLFAQRVGWTAPMNYGTSLSPAVGVESTVLFLTLAAALLALVLGWAVIRARCWWLTALLTLLPLMPGLLSDVYPEWYGFLALAACWCAMLLTSLCGGAEADRRGLLDLIVLPSVAVLLVLITVLFPMDGYIRPQWALDAERAIVDFGNRWLSFLSEWDGPFHDTTPQPEPPKSVELSNSGPLEYSGQAVLRVTSGVTGHYYLRGSSFDVYTGSSWEAFPEETYQEYLDSLPEDAWSGSPLLFLGMTRQGGTYTATVESVGMPGAAPLPYQMVEQNWDEAGVHPFRDSCFAPNEDAWRYTVTLTSYCRDLNAMLNYLDGSSSSASGLFSSYPDPSTADLSNSEVQSPLTGEAALAEQVYRDYVYSHYLDVSDDARETVELILGAYINSLSSYIPDPHSIFFLANAIPNALAIFCTYDQNTPATPEGEDFVTYFLTESRRGYCMHFATAGVLMFRSMGVPARYVSGYSVDLYRQQTVSIPDSAAHAWVEIYVDGYGWYPVEVTPGFSGDFTPVTEDEPDATDAPIPSEEPDFPPEPSEEPLPSETVSPSESPVESGPAESAFPDDPGGVDWDAVLAVVFLLARWAAAIGLAAAVIWLGQFLPKRLRMRRLTTNETNRAVLEGYRCLNRMKRWGGRVPPEARALAEKAMYSQHTLTEEERQAMLGWFNGERKRLWMRLYGFRRLTFLYLWGGPGKS